MHGQQNIVKALMNIMDKSELRNDTIVNFTSTLFILPWYNTSRFVCVYVCVCVCVCVNSTRDDRSAVKTSLIFFITPPNSCMFRNEESIFGLIQENFTRKVYVYWTVHHCDS